MEKQILEALNLIELKTAGWECSEDIMTFNGEPIGATISKSSRLEMDRWWPALKRHIAKFVAGHLTSQSSRPLFPCGNCGHGLDLNYLNPGERCPNCGCSL